MKKLFRPKFKLGDKVVDTWYPEAGTGVITKILKTRTKVYFECSALKGGWQCPLFRGAKENGELTYDKSHYKFLQHENLSTNQLVKRTNPPLLRRHQYFPKGKKIGGEIFKTIKQTKESLEND